MGQRYERLAQEHLNVGVNRIWVENPGGGQLRSTQIGIHTLARGQQAYTATWAPGTIADGDEVATTITVPDATTGDVVWASHTGVLTDTLQVTGHVSAANTVTAVISNKSGASVAVASGTLSVLVFDVSGQTKADANCVPPTAGFTFEIDFGFATFTDTSTGTGIDTWSWDFGNPGSGEDNTSTLQNPTHLFTSTGSFDVVLTVTGECGSDDFTDTVEHIGE